MYKLLIVICQMETSFMENLVLSDLDADSADSWHKLLVSKTNCFGIWSTKIRLKDYLPCETLPNIRFFNLQNTVQL